MSAIILAGLAATFPEVLLNPGPLISGHQSLRKECLSCHKPFAGVTSVQCISCHKQSDISVRNVAGGLLPINTTKVLFHRGVSSNSCIECHTDHKGSDSKKTSKHFKHEALPLLQQKECIACHSTQKPQDAMHRFAKGSCAECHGTKNWKPATFNHSKLSASSAKQCISCHKADLPKDTLHRISQANCAVCHKTTAWKPATFDHNRYFRLDGDHRASCVTCHTEPGNYKKYTCYNCHEHSAARIIRKHEKEGIFNYQNCMKCHRDGSKEGGNREGDDGRDD